MNKWQAARIVNKSRKQRKGVASVRYAARLWKAYAVLRGEQK